VLAVGADDTRGTPGVGDDVVPDWSSRGDGVRNPDLVAPGAHIVSLRDPGSYIDTHHPEGRVGDDFFKGSGTSQATAVVSGAAALLLSQRPDLTPDQVKAILTSSASDLPAADDRAQGAGLIDVQKALQTPTPDVHQTWPSSDGSGSLEAARGSAHVTDPDGNVLQGEVDVQGTTWSGTTWSGTTWSGGQWNGTTWSGTTWSNDAWDGTTWSGTTWSGTTWSGTTWSGTTWSGTTWSNDAWDGTTWSGTTWSGTTWSDTTWSGTTWSGTTWSGTTWSGTTWSNDAWDGTTWSGTTWSGTTWSDTTWSGTTWSGTTWS
jgi:serine protease AprX